MYMMCILSHVYLWLLLCGLCSSIDVYNILIVDSFEMEDTISCLFVIPIYKSYIVYPIINAQAKIITMTSV
jgi:hypothetical protein